MKILILAAFFAGFVFAGCTSQNSTYPATTTTTIPASAATAVNISGLAFSPASVIVSVDATVVWTNNDSVSHTVSSTSGPASFDSGTFGVGGTFSHQFTIAGTYAYRCNIHPSMTGQVIVQ
ncbi:MAG: plastocyanin/azurin family copper-binding protein [Candidatus Margulisiibacteriota bacterium]